jgi:hypothetical protein
MSMQRSVSIPTKTPAAARAATSAVESVGLSYGAEGPLIRPVLAQLTPPPNAIVQRTRNEAIDAARRHHPGSNYESFEQVHANKDRFSPEEWRSIVDAHNRGNTGSTRMRYTPPSPPPVVAPPRAQPTSSVSDHLHAAASTAGYANMGASALEHVVDNPVSNLLADVPVLGAASSAKISVDKKAQAEQSYLRGDLGNAARHGLGSIASGIKSVSDATTVATGGLSAPLTLPVSTVASLVNTATSVPEYLQTASNVASDPRRTLSNVASSIADVPDTVDTIASSVSSFGNRVSSAFRGATDYVGLTKAEREEPSPPSEEEQAREKEEQLRQRQIKLAALARRKQPAKDLLGKLD